MRRSVDKYDEIAKTVGRETCVPCDCGQCVKYIAQALRESAAQALRDRDSQWYAAMKWAGIGGLMRSKVNMRVVAAALRSTDGKEEK